MFSHHNIKVPFRYWNKVMPVIKQQCQNLQNWFVNNLFIQTKAEQEQLGFCLKFRCLYKMEEYILK